MQNWTETILAQFANSNTMGALTQALNAAVDPVTDLQNFYTNVFNVKTAVGAGLDAWGEIVGVSRYLIVPYTNRYLGFSEAVFSNSKDNPETFNNGIFYNNQTSGNNNDQATALNDADYRTLIMLKAASNISNLTVANINNMLQFAFPGKRAYVNDGGNMTCSYTFNFQPSAVQIAMFATKGVFPKSAGVLNQGIIATPSNQFTFAGGGGQGFNNGTLFNSTTGIIHAN